MIIREIWSIKLEFPNFFWGVYIYSFAIVEMNTSSQIQLSAIFLPMHACITIIYAL